MKRLWLLCFLLLAALGVGCGSLPSLDGRIASTALSDTAGTRLGKAAASSLAANPGKTGIHPLAMGHDAFAARILLAASADKSLDVQYYIWNADQVGSLMFEALWQAAERGVRVRLLLDDMNTGGLDSIIATLDAHPNIEVRLYNPFLQRGSRWVGFLSDFTRLNRRMHNKSFTADNQVSVVGGRNVGNEYFDAGSGIVFADFDVMAVGPAVLEVSRTFDLFWNSASAYPAALIVGAARAGGEGELKERFATVAKDPESRAFIEAVRTTRLLNDLLEGRLSLEWTRAQLLSDDPAKTLATTEQPDVLLFPKLVRAMGTPQKSLDLISPYFVPGDEGTAALVGLARSGVKVRVLTNSLASSESATVFAGYAKRRLDLLRAGVVLYEMKPTGVIPRRSRREDKPGFGSSGSAALHAKTFGVDSQRLFVGSFNFDQRSARLNTEMGLVIDSPSQTRMLAQFFDTAVAQLAYEVQLRPDGKGMTWIERTDAGEQRHASDPGATWFSRFGVGVMSTLPIDWML